MEKLYCKIAIVKNDIGTLKKQATNPFFKSKYLDLNDLLAALEPLLSQNGLLLLQPIEEGSVVTQIIDLDTSEKVVSSMAIPSNNDPQKLGSTITYFRRYTLQSLLGLQAEDDDGNAGSKQPETKW